MAWRASFCLGGAPREEQSVTPPVLARDARRSLTTSIYGVVFVSFLIYGVVCQSHICVFYHPSLFLPVISQNDVLLCKCFSFTKEKIAS